ncbi:MAG: HAMP domain-containing protein [Elusimicrobia bacterium]|nr:HAMP domain-containing protein [Elusimicrobiota bacterium]
MASPKRRGRLSVRLLLWFLILSLLPLGAVAWFLIGIAHESLSNEILSTQQALAAGFADTVGKYVATFKNVLIETAGIEEFAGMNSVKQQQFLNRIMQVHLAILELSVVSPAGLELMQTGRFLKPNPEMRRFEGEDFFNTALKRGLFMGSLERFQGLYPTMTIAVPITDPKASEPVGVLMGKVSLNGLTQMLGMEFPSSGRSSAAVLASDGFLIAHSNPKEAFRPEAKMNEELVKIITTQTEEKGGGPLLLSDGNRLFGAFAYVPNKMLDWAVFIQQPMDYAERTSAAMLKRTASIVLVVAICVIPLAWLVAGNITQPIRDLRDAADRIAKGQFDEARDLLPLDVSNEVGQLAERFDAMREALKEKTEELVGAKEKLEEFTHFLERRVEARTRELRAAQDLLIHKERLAAIGQMANVVGHEIRNPLAVIQNSSYFIKTKLGTAIDPKIAKHIKIIESEIQQASSIINEILTYSRTRDLVPEKKDLKAFIEEVVDGLVATNRIPPHVNLIKRVEVDATVNIDVQEMVQALRNIINNAVEVMPTSGSLGIQSYAQGEWAVIEIADSGPGIPQDVLDKIFVPFYSTKARGTGLGLSVVKKVMDRHKGDVKVDSALGKGTVFRLYLPIHTEPGPGQAPPPSPGAATAR